MNIMKDLSLTNYVAISVLENLGIDPSQKQIDVIELLVLMATYPLEIDAEVIKRCLSGDKLAYHSLVIKNKELYKRVCRNLS